MGCSIPWGSYSLPSPPAASSGWTPSCARVCNLPQRGAIESRNFCWPSPKQSQMTRSARWLLAILGFLLILISVSALKLGDLRKHTVEFEWLFFSAFLLYSIACFIALRSHEVSRGTLFGIFGMAIIMQGVLTVSRPTLTD